MENLSDDLSYMIPPNKIIRGQDALLRHFESVGILQRHRGKYWKHRLTEQATMVFTTPRQAAWYLVRSRRAKPLSEEWARIFRD